jgi:hypothetical protein
MPDELVNVPDDLALIASDDEVRALETMVVAEFARVNDEEVSPASLQYMMRLATDLERLRVEIKAREIRAKDEAERVAKALAEQHMQVENRVRVATGQAPLDMPQLSMSQPPVISAPPVDIAEITNAAVQGTTAAFMALLGERSGGAPTGALERITERARTSLSAAGRHAPAPDLPKTPRQVVTAGVDIPGIARGGELGSLDALVDAFHRRAKGMPATRDGRGVEQLVATMRNSFEHTIDDRTSLSQVEELVRYLTSQDKKNALVAGGGWCAPSETRYDFFNVSCVDGLIDLPTFGVTRGGIRYPVSPSIADAFGANGLGGFAAGTMSNSTVPWTWTETDDINTVTGSGTKPCLRVPCPTFAEARLECTGICLTVGNLTDDAYPESTKNTLRLLLDAHDHAVNARHIAQMVALSTSAVTGIGTSTNPAYQQVLGGIDLAATDYRAKHGMCMDDVLEVVVPFWLRAVIRADLAWRAGVSDMLSVSNEQINSYFADRNVRVQYVNDWQVRGSGQFGNAATNMLAWPTTVSVMVYAAGTFLKGNGLTLDLGVVRDSVLNAENDFTAAWSEECHLIVKLGHESRLYTLGFNVSGTTGALLAAGARI